MCAHAHAGTAGFVPVGKPDEVHTSELKFKCEQLWYMSVGQNGSMYLLLLRVHNVPTLNALLFAPTPPTPLRPSSRLHDGQSLPFDIIGDKDVMGRPLEDLEDGEEDAFRAVEADGMPRYLPSMTQGGE